MRLSLGSVLSVPGLGSAIAVAGLVAAAACSSASGGTSGGTDLFDASSGTPNADADPSADAGVLSCARAGAGTGTTYTDLYNDYFGPTGGASCAGTGSSCHASADSAGAQSANFVCGTSKDSCYTGMLDKDSMLLVSSNSADPSHSGLVMDLRKTSGIGTNNMPQAPVCFFTDADIARISAWIDAGMQND